MNTVAQLEPEKFDILLQAFSRLVSKDPTSYRATHNIDGLRAQIARGMQVLATIFGDYARSNKYFSIDDVANKLADHMSMNKYARQV